MCSNKYWYIHPEKKALLSAFAATVSASQILLGKQEWEYEQFSACIMWCETGVRSPKNPVGCTQRNVPHSSSHLSSIAHTMIKARNLELAGLPLSAISSAFFPNRLRFCNLL
ncbi:hypothetical protein EV359DRAFT_67336 [Lentinula novae-zelandiae]|nr:hypothetical protein EV359DRAFT_67336 [Lentinula novae-zelandiae]